MSKTGRGCLVLLGVVGFMAACVAITFVALPAAGSGATLPVIVVPGEPYLENWPSKDFMWTNTLTATLLASIIVLVLAVLGYRASKGWTKEVPGRLQGILELLGDFVYGQTKNFAGTKPLARNWLFPLAASIFVFLLAANWMKLLPGVETVGVKHCAGHAAPEIGITISAGHPVLGNQLYVPRPLAAAYPADEADYHACEEYKEGKILKPEKDVLKSAAATLREEEAAILLTKIAPEAQQQQIEELRLEVTEALWPEAAIGLTPDELEMGVVPYLQVITPYVRGATTDLNLTIGLALIAFVAIQVFGIAAQGPNYFQKFVNLNALGNLGKKPLGAIDFIVGLLEIISELGKIVSLSFRLFGNMFAGGILLAVMSFLVALFLPIIFIGLELIVTTIQAFVFAILTIVFSAQAMEGHHGDEEHHDEAHDHA